MTTANSDPFSNIGELIKALAAAPQNKEGAFRVSTWLMVLKEIEKISQQIGTASETIESNKNKIENTENPTLTEITAKIKEDLANQDATKIIF